jgi:hypothetical protein
MSASPDVNNPVEEGTTVTKTPRDTRVWIAKPSAGLAALQTNRQVIGDGAYRDPVLLHGIALAHGHGVILE